MPYQATTPVSQQIGILHAGSTPLITQQKAVSLTASGVVVAAPPAGYQIAVVQAFLTAGAAFTAVALESTNTTAIILPIGAMASGGLLVFPFSQCPWLTCASGDSLTLTFTGTGTLAGSVNYVILPAVGP
jgi:hypothetical protein